jgi:predicted secreted hydrolase
MEEYYEMYAPTSRSLRMKRLFPLLLSIALFLSSASAQEYRDVTREHKPEFPGDFYFRKDYRVQWWYFTGHLFDEDSREFGYELTFFVVGIQTRQYKSKFGVDNIYISHFAVSDVNEKKYYYGEEADSGAFNAAGASDRDLRVWVGKNVLEGSIKKMHITAFDKGRALDLVLMPQKPVVLNGENGYSRKSEESPLLSSVYFSYTDMKTDGSLRIGDTIFHVRGKSWFDREISSKGLSKEETGWDWFSIRLDDGREIMLYILRKKDGSLDRYSSGTVVYRDGRYRHLSLDDFKVSVSGHYKSKKTGAVYPSQWEVRIPSENLALRLAPLMEDQEFIAAYSTGNYYWEGVCRVEGTEKGRAYVEMTGY